MSTQKSPKQTIQQLPDDLQSLDTQVLGQCTVAQPQPWLQTDLAKSLLPHLVANYKRLSAEYVQECFNLLKDWEMLTTQQWFDMLALV
jgi:hypothetical protein